MPFSSRARKPIFLWRGEVKVSELTGPKKKEWEEFLADYHTGKLRHHSRGFLYRHVCARLGLTFTKDRFARYLKVQQ